MSVNWFDIATINLVKKFMNVCAFSCTDISFYPKAGLKVALVPPKIDVPRELTVKDAFEKDGHFLVTFKEVTKKTEMQDFDGMHLLVSDLCDLECALDDSFVGWTLINNGQEFEILDAIEMPTQILVTIEGDIDLPLHDDFIDEVDEENQIIKTHFEDYFFEN